MPAKGFGSTIVGMTELPLDILYDDGPCLVVNKPAGLLTQAPPGIDSLEITVREYYRQRECKAADANLYLAIVHRLDRPVSGAITFARHLRAAQRLAKQFQERTVSKSYWALVEGKVTPEEGTWTDHLHKRHGMAQAIVVPEDDPRGKIAVLHYRVQGEIDGATWLEIELETGRTHQIRVQSSSRGYPVLGDSQYGATRTFGPTCEDPRDGAIALHARTLGFRHPMRDESVVIEAPLPDYWPNL